MQKVIDYCARNAVVPRKEDHPRLPEPWEGVSTETIQRGLRDDHGVTIGNGTATYTWQRLGADNDLDAALSFLRERRDAFIEAGFHELTPWTS